jgi:hypothetical protein
MSDNKPSDAPIAQPGARDPHYAELYSNSVKIAITPADISIIFGVIDNLPNAPAVIRDIAAIRMAPVMFKVLTQSVATNLREWEKSFGEINVPPGYSASEDAIIRSFANVISILKSRVAQS